MKMFIVFYFGEKSIHLVGRNHHDLGPVFEDLLLSFELWINVGRKSNLSRK